MSVIILSVFLIACGEPELDTSSDQAMKESAKEIMSTLSSEDKNRFQKTVTGIYMMAGFAAMGSNVSAEDARAKVNEMLDGKTAEEIFALADEIKKASNE